MDKLVQIFALGADGVPHPDGELAVHAESLDGLAACARAALVERRYRVRCVSFTPAGMVAYVERPR